MKRILLLGAGGPAGVNFSQCLQGEEDIEIYGVDTNRYNLNFAKQYCKKVFGLPYCKDWDDRIEYCNQLIEENNIDFIHAQPDPEVLFISEFRRKLKAKTFLPSRRTIEVCQDKYETALAWNKLFGNLTYPVKMKRDDELNSVIEAYNKLGLPFWMRASYGAGGKASLCVKTVEQGYHWLRFWHSFDKEIEMMAQPYLMEPNIAWQSLWKDGKLIVSQGRNRIEALYGRLTVSGISGSSSVSRLNNHRKANEAGVIAVKAIDPEPNGLYSVDMMGYWGWIVPTEINAGRMFTMSYLLGKASMEFNIPRGNIALMYIKLAFGEELPDGEEFNVLPSNVYWLRHVDCGTHLIKKEDLI